VHRGFVEGYKSVEPQILEALLKVWGLPLYITGHFLMAAFRLFGPLVGDHGIEQYRRNLEAVAQERNLDLFCNARLGGK
jgi:hypothetical protein